MFWRSGYKLSITPDNILQERAIICVCWKYEGEDRVHHLEWDKGDDKKLVQKFSKIIEDSDELIAHNGDKFDLRWFQGRNLIHGLPPIPKSKTVDTLKLARKNFYLNSNRLDYIGKVLFGEGKIHTEFSLWKRILIDNEPSAMKEMVRYCKQDVVLLEKVYKELSKYDEPKTHLGVYSGGDRWTCPRCASSNVLVSKTRVSAKGIESKQMKCRSCGGYYAIASNVWRDYLEAKRKEE
jgi:hypothetical protein